MSKRHQHSFVYCNIIHNSKEMETTWLSINWYTDKENVVHIHNGILFNYEKKWNPVIVATWIELEITMVSGWN
jgi:hypothetical protein